jgi:hypothetical protein
MKRNEDTSILTIFVIGLVELIIIGIGIGIWAYTI